MIIIEDEMEHPEFDSKKTMSLDDLRNNFEEDEVRCAQCKKRHFPDEETFLTFYGNATVGFNGGLIGNNFNENGTLGRLTFVCRDIKCLTKILMIESMKP